MIVSALAVSCTDDELVKGGSKYNVVPDIPVTLQLKVQLSGSKIATRAAQDENTEKTIQNIYVMAFKPEKGADGKENVNASAENWVLDNAKMFDGKDGADIVYNEPQYLDGVFPMTTGIRKIYAIANPYNTPILESSVLSGIQTLADLKNLEATLTDGGGSIERMYLKMVGQAKPVEGGNEYVTVTDDRKGKGKILEKYSLKLSRVDARITFKITTQKTTTRDGEYSELKFTPESYHVMRIPGGTYILPREKGAGTDNINTWDSSAGGYSDGLQTSDFETDGESSVFEFYLFENRQKPKENISSSLQEANRTLYSFREEQGKTDLEPPTANGQTVKNGAFKYAHENSTYVIISGTLTGKRKDDSGATQEMYAKVNYTVHLGATGNLDEDQEGWLNNEMLVNNYDVERNTHYTYNVTIAGVDKIIVEVESEGGKDEQQPGAEGDVILTTGNYVTLDSHYSRYVMNLEKEEILNGLSWSISTPFQRGLKVFKKNEITADAYLTADNQPFQTSFGLSQNELSLNDYKWVKFAINKECIKVDGSTFGPNEVIKYPGEQAYDGGEPNKNTPAPIAGGKYINTSFYKQVRLYDVNQLLNFLYYQASQGQSDIFERDVASGKEVVHITVFVDEYVYIYDPTLYYYRKPTGIDEGDTGEDEVVDLSLWKKVVNGSNRLLNICVEGSQYSADGQSSVSQSVYTISQNPVYTFYNPTGTGGDFESAWGVEASVETKFLPIVPSSGITGRDFASRFDNVTNTRENGRSNMLNILKQGTDLKWDAVINTDISDINNILLRDYRSIWYACLMRNRDLNGDDIVQASEIRWYLASIDQLTDMFIGEAGIPTAKLYQAEVNNDWSAGSFGKDGQAVHIASSSYYDGDPYDTNDQNKDPKNSPTNPYVIWGEEGVSKGSARYSLDYDVVDNFSYRCVRNLGLRLSDRGVMPVDYVDAAETESTHITSTNETYQELLIDVSKMANNCIRGSIGIDGGVLPKHDEKDANNRPPLKLAILSGNDNSNNSHTEWVYPRSGSNWTSTTWAAIQRESSEGICPEGYRVPNLRELALIYTTYPNLAGGDVSYYATKTAYSRATDDKYTFGYLVYKGNLVLYGGGGAVRCVRDATDDRP